MFNDQYGLTQAVLEGRKTMTRRVIGNRMTDYDIEAYLKGYTVLANLMANFKIGEVVAVAQRYSELSWDAKFYEMLKQEYGLTSLPQYELKGWNNKMCVRADLMPHQIKITDIKIERLQEISDDDCIKEGIIIDTRREVLDDNIYMFDKEGKHTSQWHFPSPREAFAALIDKVSGKGTWKRNPFVFCYSLKIIN